jgi:acetolactate synthase-1/2/3 large subunit
MRTTTAALFARVLADAGVNVVAGIPGHSNYAFANAVADEKRIMPLTLRHEAIGTLAADAYFRVSGKVMGVFTHTLAGTANGIVGVANAFVDSSAMLFIVGEEPRATAGRGAYQEISRAMDGDLPQMVRHVTKRSWITHTPAQIVEQTYRALRMATSGRPGPTSLHVFCDLWEEEVDIPSWPSPAGFLPVTNDSRPSVKAVESGAELLRRARRPVVLAGNGVNLSRAQKELLAFAETHRIPIATSTTGKGAFPENHALSLGVIGWVGTSTANWAARNADVVLVIGARMSETTTSSWQPEGLIDPSKTQLIHADIETGEVANVFPVKTSLIADAKATLTDLTAALGEWTAPREWLSAVEAEKSKWGEVARKALAATSTPLPVGPVVQALRELTAGTPVNIVCDVGKSHKWLVQQFESHAGDIIVSSMGAGTMGIGPCGAVGAALGRPQAKTFTWVGDGSMSMSLPVLPTVAEYKIPVVFLVVDDGCYGAVANAQENRYGRAIYSEFNANGNNPDYRLDLARVAEACGVPGRRVDNIDAFRSALRWGLEQAGPVLIDVVVDRKSVAPHGGGFKLPDTWNHPVFPWQSQSA